MDTLCDEGPRSNPGPAFLCTSVTPIPTNPHQAYYLGLAAGERREDLVFTLFAAMELWRPARGPFVASELAASFCCGWFESTSTWFDTEGGGR
jgi:hypothetical protein